MLTLLNEKHAIHKEGISFAIVGDFGPMNDLSYANIVFDAIALMKEDAVPGSPEDFDFFITSGDNMYPEFEENPSEEEFANMMGLFLDRHALKEIPIYPVRGNNDCYFREEDLEIKLEH